MQQVLQILDYGVAIAIMVMLIVFARKIRDPEKIRFSNFSLAMMCISFCDMVIDGLQGEGTSFVISALLSLFWIYNYRRDRKREITP